MKYTYDGWGADEDLMRTNDAFAASDRLNREIAENPITVVDELRLYHQKALAVFRQLAELEHTDEELICLPCRAAHYVEWGEQIGGMRGY
jgi:hypothetical protein